MYAVGLLHSLLKRLFSPLIAVALLLVLTSALPESRLREVAHIGAVTIASCALLYCVLCIVAHGFLQGVIAMHFDIAVMPSQSGVDEVMVLDLKVSPARYHSALLQHAPAILRYLKIP